MYIMTDVFEYVNFDGKELTPLKTNKNIDGCFVYFNKNPFGLCSGGIVNFVKSLKKYYKTNGTITDKQFISLLNIMRYHEKIIASADNYIKDVGCR